MQCILQGLDVRNMWTADQPVGRPSLSCVAAHKWCQLEWENLRCSVTPKTKHKVTPVETPGKGGTDRGSPGLTFQRGTFQMTAMFSLCELLNITRRIDTQRG